MKNYIVIIFLFCSMIFSKKDDSSPYSKTSIGFDFLSLSRILATGAPSQHQTGVYFSTHSSGMIFELYFGYKFTGSEIDNEEEFILAILYIF